MRATPFNHETDLPPIPFDETHCRLAAKLKEAGLPWKPHVGCFVWDRDEHIPVPSPFPGRIYFILNLHRFLEIFGSVEQVADCLVWLPTWHQARLLCSSLGVHDRDVTDMLCSEKPSEAGKDLLALYETLLNVLVDETG